MVRGRGNATSYSGSGVLKLPSQSHRRQRYRCTGRHRLLSRSIKRRRTRRTSCPQFGHWRFSEIECGSPSRRSSNGIPKHATPFAGRAVSRQTLHTACKSSDLHRLLLGLRLLGSRKDNAMRTPAAHIRSHATPVRKNATGSIFCQRMASPDRGRQSRKR